MKYWRNGAKISDFVRRSKDTTMPSRWREHPELVVHPGLLRPLCGGLSCAVREMIRHRRPHTSNLVRGTSPGRSCPEDRPVPFPDEDLSANDVADAPLPLLAVDDSACSIPAAASCKKLVVAEAHRPSHKTGEGTLVGLAAFTPPTGLFV